MINPAVHAHNVVCSLVLASVLIVNICNRAPSSLATSEISPINMNTVIGIEKFTDLGGDLAGGIAGLRAVPQTPRSQCTCPSCHASGIFNPA